jgi:hypothetical protein
MTRANKSEAPRTSVRGILAKTGVAKRGEILKMKDTGKEMCSFLEKKLILIKRYLSITEHLKEKIRKKEEFDFEDLLSERQNCIRQIERIDRSMKKIRDEGSAKLSHVSDPVKTPAQSFPFPWPCRQGGGEARPPLLTIKRGRRDGGAGLIEDYLKDIKGMLDTAYGIDRELMAAVKEESERMQYELLRMRSTRQAVQDYRMVRGLSPRFLDAVK